MALRGKTVIWKVRHRSDDKTKPHLPSIPHFASLFPTLLMKSWVQSHYSGKRPKRRRNLLDTGYGEFLQVLSLPLVCFNLPELLLSSISALKNSILSVFMTKCLQFTKLQIKRRPGPLSVPASKTPHAPTWISNGKKWFLKDPWVGLYV